MKSKPLVAAVIGFVLLLVGGFIQFSGTAPSPDADLTQACRAEVQNRGGDSDMAKQCSDKTFAVAMTATNANDAARAISAANQQEIGGNAVSIFLLGLGLVLFGTGLFGVMKQHKTPQPVA